ncbi:Uncharacterized protein dnl_10010 [Desulfonema limicola]|uniref:Uncharacterized protein n=1 Tax=Desulfonema limicola TaxID=45656 RepID=A0A975B4Q7_9BACT|nr:hypothetical protein [Desulfonema limicola]QTA78767.1 Uncharacterized protein dnl_10010 [Desulfonema limicola]
MMNQSETIKQNIKNTIPAPPKIIVGSKFSGKQSRKNAEKEKHRRWMLYGTSWITEIEMTQDKPESTREIAPISGISNPISEQQKSPEAKTEPGKET